MQKRPAFTCRPCCRFSSYRELAYGHNKGILHGGNDARPGLIELVQRESKMRFESELSSSSDTDISLKSLGWGRNALCSTAQQSTPIFYQRFRLNAVISFSFSPPPALPLPFAQAQQQQWIRKENKKTHWKIAGKLLAAAWRTNVTTWCEDRQPSMK